MSLASTAFSWKPWFGSRRYVVFAIFLATVFCFAFLDLETSALLDLKKDENGRTIAHSFFSAALEPALEYERFEAEEGEKSFLEKVGEGALKTLLFASAGVSLALIFGLIGGFLCSTAWWPKFHERNLLGKLVAWMLRSVFFISRGTAALARSIHEFYWALLFITAIETSPLAGVFAIAIPYAGIMARIFSEMIDEQSRDAAETLRSIGANSTQTFVVGILPQAIPDLLTYTFYRFECALRSSTIIGFLGIETLGLYIRLSFENLHYREVWTYLYVLMILIVLADLWGAAIRRRVA